jgi:pimeloyl-ACP methyl ester carboxylesterase
VDSTLTDRVVFVNGQRIHLVEAGDGPMVLLVHGHPELWYSWRHQLRALSEAGYRVVAVDKRGYGRSSKPRGIHDYRVTELVADMAGVVEALGASTATVVGHDAGAPVAWSAAWTRPDLFTAVVGMSVPFGARGQIALPTSPFGERRISEAARLIAGDGRLFYTEYFGIPGVAEREFEPDARATLEKLLYFASALPPMPPEMADFDPSALSEDELIAVIRGTTLCLRPGQGFLAELPVPPPGALDPLCTPGDLDVYVDAFERSGFTNGLNYYRVFDLNWELLAAYDGRPLEVPALFIGGDRDPATMWGQTAIREFGHHAPKARPPVILPNCGHWTQQEQPDKVNELLLAFLAEL